MYGPEYVAWEIGIRKCVYMGYFTNGLLGYLDRISH